MLFWILLQIVFKELNLFVGLIGVRNWVLYFWFAILIFRSFNKWQLDYLIKKETMYKRKMKEFENKYGESIN